MSQGAVVADGRSLPAPFRNSVTGIDSPELTAANEAVYVSCGGILL